MEKEKRIGKTKMNIAEQLPTISLLIGLAIAIRELRKGPSEQEARVTGTAVDLVDRLAARLATVEKELDNLRTKLQGQEEQLEVQSQQIDNLRTENEWLKNGVAILVNQLQEHNIPPLWKPDMPAKRQNTEKKNDRSNKKRGF